MVGTLLSRYMGRWRAARASALILTTALLSAVPVNAAHADTPTASERCQRGGTPDLVETVTHRGGEEGVNFPQGPDPDNVIFPGDVVRVTISGSVRYNLWGSTVGPDGHSIAASAGWPFPGLNELSSVARWNNKPGGWVGSPLQTTSLSGCTPAPPSHGARLAYFINDGQLWDNSGEWSIRTELFRAPGRIAIDGIELTQGIQTPGGDVPLIAYKRTFVRVYVRGTDDGRGPLSGVAGYLTVEGISRPFYPVNGLRTTAAPGGSDRRTLADSFLFQLHSEAIRPGTRKLTVTLTPPPGRGGSFYRVTRTSTVTFGPAGDPVTLSVFGARYSYHDVPAVLQAREGLRDDRWQARPVSAWEPLRVTAENALPLAGLTITDLAPNEARGSTSVACRGRQGDDGRWGCLGFEDGRKWAEDTIDARCPNGGCWIVVLQPEITDGHLGAWGMTARGNHVINLQGEAQPEEQGITLAHEIGHGLSLGHTFEDPAYPRRDGGLGPYVGLRYSPSLTLIAGEDRDRRTAAYDLMSYSSPAWISPYSFCQALKVSSSTRMSCPSTFRG